DRSLGRAYYKAMLAAGNPLPTQGAVYVTVRDEDKPTILPVVQRLVRIGLRIFATRGTAQFLRENGVDATTVYRISENEFPDALGLMRRGEIRLVINTPTNSTGARRDGYMMRRLAVDLNIPFIATVQAAEAAVQAIEEFSTGDLAVVPLQEYRRIAANPGNRDALPAPPDGAAPARRWGGVLFLGPIPLICGSDPRMTRTMLLIGIVLFLALLALTVIAMFA